MMPRRRPAVPLIFLCFSISCAYGFLSVTHRNERGPLRDRFSRPSKGSYDEEEDDEPPEVDVANFSGEVITLGPGKSSPSARKAMGTSQSSAAKIHICTNCGSEFVKWMGRCPTCKEWNTLQEHTVQRKKDNKAKPVFGGSGKSWLDGVAELDTDDTQVNTPVPMTELQEQAKLTKERLEIPQDDEINQVLGGGLMEGSIVLMGGEPGVGKSTLLLQIAGSLASLAPSPPGIGMGSVEEFQENPHGPVWYVSGEESPNQVAHRASRLGISSSQLLLLSETNVDTICQLVVRELHQQNSFSEDQPPSKPPALIVVDSIQTCICQAGGNSGAGGVTQVRECVAVLLRLAKATGIAIMIVGHVTKAGGVAGPKTVEHMVDAVLYLEHTDTGSGTSLRLLRASKNRFGSADQVGVYRMTSGRMEPVSDPSSLFLQHRSAMVDLEGSAVCVTLEGLRAVTSEVQALVTQASGGQFGRKIAQGLSMSRLQLLTGVLQKRCGVALFKQDVYINVAGGSRGAPPVHHSTDLAVAMALVSSLTGIAVRSDTAFCGEIGLLGELRMVPELEKRLEEARRMGFSRVVTPRQFTGRPEKSRSESPSTLTRMVKGIEWIQCERLSDALNTGLVSPLPKRQRKPSRKGPATIQDLGLPEIVDDEDDYSGDDSFL